MAKPTKIEQALFDVTTIPSDSMEQIDAPGVQADDGEWEIVTTIPGDSMEQTDAPAVQADDGEWEIETNYRGEIVNSYPKARNAGK